MLGVGANLPTKMLPLDLPGRCNRVMSLAGDNAAAASIQSIVKENVRAHQKEFGVAVVGAG